MKPKFDISNSKKPSQVPTPRSTPHKPQKNTKQPPINTPQAKCDVHRIDVNAINNEKVTFAVYRIFVMCDVHRI